MKEITITSKYKADKVLINSLFQKGGTLNKIKYCTGKYKNSGNGKKIQVSNDVMAVWSERRTDKWGKYYVLYCYVKPDRGIQ